MPFKPYRSFFLILSTLVCLILSTSCGITDDDGGHGGPSDAPPVKLRIKQERYDLYAFEGPDSSRMEVVETLLDTSGKVTLETFYDGSYTRTASRKYIYNTFGKLTYSSYLESFTYKETDTISYDQEGRPVRQEKLITNQHVPLRRTITEFRNGKVSVKREEDLLSARVNWIDTFQWNQAGSKMVKTGYSGEGRLLFTSHTTYDSAGNELAYERFSPEGKSLSRVRHQYDPKGNLIMYEEMKGDSITLKEVSTYDANGKKTKLEVYEPGSRLSMVYEYFYNENGDKSWVSKYDGKGKLLRRIRYTYEYH